MALLILFSQHALAQQTILTGKVSDATTEEGIPFANLIFLGTSKGTTTDFEGNYKLSASGTVDSLQISYLGYKKKVVAVKPGQKQQLNIALEPEAINLQELVVYSKGNPALELLKKVHAHREENDLKKLEAFEYESYVKTGISFNNLSEANKEAKLVKKALAAIQQSDSAMDIESDVLIPFTMTESISRIYFQSKPEIRKEEVLKSRTTGIGFKENSWLSQIITTTLKQYNFYENWVTIMTKNFASPLAGSGKLLYDYYLADSLYIGNDFCYKVECTPKSEQDLAFNGVIWITKNEYALKKIDVTISEKANLNYVETIHIQQELERTAAGPWLPSKTEIIIDSEEFGKQPGLLIKTSLSQKDIKVNEPKPAAFYSDHLVIAETAYDNTEAYWQAHRHEALSEADSMTYSNIETLKEEPTIKRYSTVLDIFMSAYYKFDKFALGPFIYSYANNSVECHRFRMGIKTNEKFSRNWIFRGYGAYGLRDREFKYGVDIDYLLSRKPWTQLNFHHSHDMSQIGIVPEDDKEVYFFHAASLFGDMSRAYYYDRSSLTLMRQLPYGVFTRVGLRREYGQPLFEIHAPGLKGEGVPTLESYTSTEAVFDVRFARDEMFVQRDNRRLSLGMGKWPVFRMQYTLGLAGVLGGNVSYQKLQGTIDQRLKMGLFGKTLYSISGAYIFSQVPFPLLSVHLGNNSFFYYKKAFNTMSRYEFISDHFVALQFNHFFEGFIFNRIPAIKKLGWRLLGSANIIYGGVREENRSYRLEDGEYVPEFGFLKNNIPFVEVGYGIENIFKIVRIDAFHRLTYLDKPNASKFALKVGFQIKF